MADDDDRAARLAEQLRANLTRRKGQRRARKADDAQARREPDERAERPQD